MRLYCAWNNNGRTLTSEQKPLLSITAGCFVVSADWQGSVNRTESGRECQLWSLDTPHQHTYRDGRIFAGRQLAIDAKNYCRDPRGGDGRLWCYTTDPSRRWEYCNVPKCTVPITTLTLSPNDDPVSLIVNQASLFTCTSDFGLPAPSIHWYLDYGTPHDIMDDINLTCASSSTTSRKHITTSTLTVMPSKYEHNMRLYCKGNNGSQPVTSNVEPWIKVLHTDPSVTSRLVLQNATLSRRDIAFGIEVLTGVTVGCIAFGFGAGMCVMWCMMHQRTNAKITKSSGSNYEDMKLQFETNVKQIDDTYMTVEDDRIETYLNPIT
ncbi:hypothetical protein DPMN_151308 [Dreissena polymorpha]|uniref:Uncharacterized protein n=1 Tax=Dreissena polymorpha TaxID=45954 RepID=A0A9D4J766_DREPO|nr:hypothetical protein DPMN_151308 [Dreissena polymorpha]